MASRKGTGRVPGSPSVPFVVSVIGFSVVIWQFTRAANAQEGSQAVTGRA